MQILLLSRTELPVMTVVVSPFIQCQGNKLRAIVGLNGAAKCRVRHNAHQCLHDILTRQRLTCFNGETFSGEVVYDGQCRES